MLFFSVETLLLLLLILFLIRYYVKKRWSVLKELNIPHDPPTVLGMGSLGDVMKDPDNVFKMDLERKKKFGKIYGAYAGLDARIVVADPAILKQIFIKEFSNFRDRQNVFRKVNGKEVNQALFSASGAQWKRTRQTLSPAFSVSKLKEMSGIIEKCVDKTIANLNEFVESNNGRFDAKMLLGKLSMDTLCSVGFTADTHSQDSADEENQVVKHAKKMFSQDLFRNPLVFLFALFPFTEKIAAKLNYSIFGNDNIRYFSRLVDCLISNKAKFAQRVDIMQTMLQMQVPNHKIKEGITKGLTRTEIVGNAILMILAGYETTGNAMVFLMYNLATHPEVQEKLREEIDNTIENYGELSYEAVNSMKYLMMCVNESLRLYIPAARNFRLAEKEITINGLRIPAGTQVEIPSYGLAHDEEYWDEPMKYKPERMEDMSKIDPMTFTPFGAGPRNCIAMRMALLEVKLACCKILHNFILEPCEDTQAPPLDITFKASMQPKSDVFLRAIPRNKA